MTDERFDVAGSVPHRHVEWLLGRVWQGSGVPPEELEFLHSLSVPRAETVRRRLRSMVELDEAEAAGMPMSIGDAQRRSGVGRTFFYLLRQRWRENRRLADLAPHEKPVVVEKGESLNAELVGLVREAFRSRPLGADADIARELRREHGLAQDHRTLTRLVHRERLDVARNADVLAEVFGLSLLIDASAVALSVRHTPHDQALVVALVMEQSTGLLLGHSAGLADQGVDLQFRAIVNAMAFIAEERIDREAAAKELAFARIVVGPGDEGKVETAATAMAGVAADVWSSGWRRHGELAAAVLGRRIGRLTLKPMATATGEFRRGDDASYEEGPLDLDEAARRVDGLVRRHQGARLKALRENGVTGSASVGTMHRALSAIASEWP